VGEGGFRVLQINSGGGGLDGGGGEQFKASEEVGVGSVHPDHFGFDHLPAGGEGAVGTDVEAEDVAGDDWSGKGKGEAQAGSANVGRLAGEVTRGAGFIEFDGSGLFDAKPAAALVGVSG